MVSDPISLDEGKRMLFGQEQKRKAGSFRLSWAVIGNLIERAEVRFQSSRQTPPTIDEVNQLRIYPASG
jgi:hypothetical protein